MLKVCSGVTDEKEKDGGVQEVRSDSGQRDRKRRELRYVLSVRASAHSLNLVALLLCTSELD